MTGRVQALIVALDRDVREDDPQLDALKACIQQLRGVAAVSDSLSSPDAMVTRARVRAQIAQDVGKLIDKIMGV